MAHQFTRLLSSLTIGQHTLKNRVVLTAHGDHLARDGRVTETLIQHYERCAAGGVGLIIAGGSAPVHPEASNVSLMSLWDSQNEPQLKELAQRVHAHGAVLLSQASHRGPREKPQGADPRLVAPSPVPGPAMLGSAAALTAAEISEIVRSYADAAARLERCGFDGIEITAYGTHLIESFWSPVLNRRTDGYGGSYDNRMRFGYDVLGAVAEATSEDFLVAFRMSGDLMTSSLGLSPDDLAAIATDMTREAKIDLLDISGGSGASIITHAACVPPEGYPIGCYNHLSRRIRAQVDVPVLVAGRILDPDMAEQTIESGDADLVGMTRALIADPTLPRWLQAGKPERVRPCIAINEGCRRALVGEPLACTVNPAIGRVTSTLPHVHTARQVTVVGGGPAGMETARVAAERGHRVTLFERGNELGGQVAIAAGDPHRPHMARHVQWLAAELTRLDVAIHLDTECSVESVVDGDADVVVVATGARSYVPAAMRDLGCPQLTDVDVLTGATSVPPHGRILVYDAEGHYRGVAIATMVASFGASVEMVTSFGKAAENLEPTNKPPLYERLDASGVAVITDQRLVGTDDGRLLTQDVWLETERVFEPYDLAIFVGYREAQASLYEDLSDLGAPNVIRVGDARAPRLLRHAISEGARAGAEL